jgi:tRNA threonylcarbamoyladenosine biosynthesis protein TsaB
MPAPTVIAIDTATEQCSVALLRGECLVEHSETVGQRHSDRVLPMLDAVLAEGSTRLADVDAFAFGAGPGSFTGLRIACGVVQGLAYGCSRQVTAIGNLRALAAAALADRPGGRTILVAIDARMHEAYCAVYRNDEELSEVRAPALELPSALPGIAREVGVDIVAGDDLVVGGAAWNEGPAIERLTVVRATAGIIARLARIDHAKGRSVRAADAMPVYVRDNVALTIEERRSRRVA